MKELIVTGIVLICLLVYVTVKKLIVSAKEKKLKEAVAFCVTDDSYTFRNNLPLYAYVLNAQIKLNLLQEYRISTDEEWNLTKEILKGFQKEVIQEFFSNQISIPTGKYVIPNETHFMYLLMCYCKKHQCDNTLLGYDMHKETVSYDGYGWWGAPLYDATYELTDFAIALHKLYLISFMNCKNSPVLKFEVANWFDEHSIEKIIDSRQISVSSM